MRFPWTQSHRIYSSTVLALLPENELSKIIFSCRKQTYQCWKYWKSLSFYDTFLKIFISFSVPSPARLKAIKNEAQISIFHPALILTKSQEDRRRNTFLVIKDRSGLAWASSRRPGQFVTSYLSSHSLFYTFINKNIK